MLRGEGLTRSPAAALLLGLFLSGCSRSSLPALRELYAQDQIDQQSYRLSQAERWSREEARIKAVLEMNDAGRIRSGEEMFVASAVLLHGHAPDQFLLCHRLALSAGDSGIPEAKWIAAACQDEYRVSIGKPQLYGTQFEYSAKRNRWRLYPVAPTLSDEDRARSGVRSLAESLILLGRLNMEGLERFSRELDADRLRAAIELSSSSPTVKGVSRGP